MACYGQTAIQDELLINMFEVHGHAGKYWIIRYWYKKGMDVFCTGLNLSQVKSSQNILL